MKSDTFSEKLTAADIKENLKDCTVKKTKIVLALSAGLGYTKRAVT